MQEPPEDSQRGSRRQLQELPQNLPDCRTANLRRPIAAARRTSAFSERVPTLFSKSYAKTQFLSTIRSLGMANNLSMTMRALIGSFLRTECHAQVIGHSQATDGGKEVCLCSCRGDGLCRQSSCCRRAAQSCSCITASQWEPAVSAQQR